MRTLAALVGLLVLAACSGSDPSTPPIGNQFVLRAWTTQALPPPGPFLTGPVVAIADGRSFSPGAVPAIYPGPLVGPVIERPISDAGISAIVTEMQRAGLLGDRTDFLENPMPGSITGHILVSLGTGEREVIGDPTRLMQCITEPCEAPPGTPEAFAAFWNRLHDLHGWLGSELGAEQVHEPERVAILVMDPTIDPTLPGAVVDWPLDVPLAEVGVPYPGAASVRCALLEGGQLDDAWPVFAEANQLTRFRDATGLERGLAARIVVPGEPDPCA